MLEAESPLPKVESPRQKVWGRQREHEEGLTPLLRSLASSPGQRDSSNGGGRGVCEETGRLQL